MNNSMVSRILGETDDVVPVIAHAPRMAFKKCRRHDNDDYGIADDDSKRDIKRLIGETDEREEVIPKDAEPLDPAEMTLGKPLRAPKRVVQEPSHPLGEKEKYLTPYAALTAPDVTPKSMEPLDPSQVPGSPKPERFTAADLAKAELVEKPPENAAATAMDVILGRSRVSKPARLPGEFEQAGAIATEAAPAPAVTILQEDARLRAAKILTPSNEGGSMPDPKPASDGSALYEITRRFTR